MSLRVHAYAEKLIIMTMGNDGQAANTAEELVREAFLREMLNSSMHPTRHVHPATGQVNPAALHLWRARPRSEA